MKQYRAIFEFEAESDEAAQSHAEAIEVEARPGPRVKLAELQYNSPYWATLSRKRTVATDLAEDR